MRSAHAALRSSSAIPATQKQRRPSQSMWPTETGCIRASGSQPASGNGLATTTSDASTRLPEETRRRTCPRRHRQQAVSRPRRQRTASPLEVRATTTETWPRPCDACSAGFSRLSARATTISATRQPRRHSVATPAGRADAAYSRPAGVAACRPVRSMAVSRCRFGRPESAETAVAAPGGIYAREATGTPVDRGAVPELAAHRQAPAASACRPRRPLPPRLLAARDTSSARAPARLNSTQPRPDTQHKAAASRTSWALNPAYRPRGRVRFGH
jgi:hypothetical protein